MKFNSPATDIYIPSAVSEKQALERCTHLCIGTHADDVELVGMHGIQTCFENDEAFFIGVVVTDGAGSPRTGKYANVTNEQMIEMRKKEQRLAAKIGKYSAMVQLGYPSKAINDHTVEDIKTILSITKPEILYLHNPLDRHASHRNTLTACIEALRQLPKEDLPKQCFGVEVWRSLDFLPSSIRVALPIDKHLELAEELIGVFKSQTEGGKRYDLAFMGRTLANATFAESHQVDQAKALSFAVDLMPLINSGSSCEEYAKLLLETTIRDLPFS